MFFCRRQIFRSCKALTRNLPRYRFSEQNNNAKNESNAKEAEDTGSSPISGKAITTVLGCGLVGFLGYAIYQDYAKKSGGLSLNGGAETSLAVRRIIEQYGKNTPEVAAALKEEAHQAYLGAQYDQSTQTYNQALQLYQKLKGSDSEEAAEIYRDIGYNMLKQNKMEEARETMQKASDMHLRLGKYTEGFDELESIALTHIADFSKAKDLFDQAILKRKEKIGTNDPLLAKTYIRYAMLYSTQQMKNEVLECLQQAFSLMKSNPVPKEKQSSVYQELSLVYHNILAFNESLSATQKAIELLDHTKDAARVAQLTKQSASLYSVLKDSPKSIETYKIYADKIQNQEGMRLELGDTYRRIAEEYEKQDNYNEAIEFWNKFIDLFRGMKKTELALSGKLKSCSLYARSKKREKAVDCFEDAFVWASSELGDDHKMTAQAFEVLRLFKDKGLSAS